MLNMEDFHVDMPKIPLSEVNYDLGVAGIWSYWGLHLVLPHSPTVRPFNIPLVL